MSPRLFLALATMEARKMMSYRADFWIGMVMGFAIQLGVVWFLWKAVFAEAGATLLQGYTFDGVIAYFLTANLLGKIVRGTDNEGLLANEIYGGSLTRYIVYPTSFFAFKYASRLGGMLPMVVQAMLIGAVCPFIVTLPESMSVTVASVSMAAVFVLWANLLHWLLYWPVEGVAFWADNVWSLNVMMRLIISLLGGAMLPLDFFPAAVRDVLLWLPFPYIFYFPTKVFLGQVSLAEFAGGLMVCALWVAITGAIAYAVWKRGDRVYTGVGI